MKTYYGTWPDPLPSGKKPKEMKKPNVIGGMGWMEAQRDADVAYYEAKLKYKDEYFEAFRKETNKEFQKLIQQAKAEVAREIENFLQMHLYARPDKPTATMKFTDWQKLRKLLSKFLKEGV